MSTTELHGGTLKLRTGEVDLGRQRLITPGGVVPLTTREAELLAYLAERAGQPVPREDLLVDVWHYRASNPTRAVDLAVKRLRSKIEPDPSEPVHVLSVHGVGYRFVPFDPTASLPPTAIGAHPSAAAPRGATNLSPERTSFVGRTAEIERLTELVDGSARLVTVTGPAGTGKTRLARRFAGAQVEEGGRFAGGAWLCDVSEVRGLEALVAAVALGVDLHTANEAGPEEVGRALAERSSREGRLLVVIDNFEHLVDFATETLGRWLDLAPTVVFLVTSRERLHVRGERILELPPLETDDGLALLLDRAAAVRRGWELSDEDRVVLGQVVSQLDGIPLAIELAASRLGTLSPTQLQKRLQSRFRLLGDPRSDRPRRHATLLAALDWSWELMTEPERSALCALSVFEGGFSLEAAEEVLDDPDDPDRPWPADLVQSLRDKSLLSVDDLAGGDLRYRLLESIRVYAAGKLEAMGGADRVRHLHATYYLREGEELAVRLYGASAVDRMEDLVRERANLVAVARHAPSTDHRIRAVLCLFPVLQARGPLGLLEELVTAAIDLGRVDDQIDRRLLARLLVDRGFHLYGRGQLSAAEQDFLDASRTAPQHLDSHARARMGLGRTLCDMGRLDEAAAAMRESIDLFSRLGDRSGEGRARSIFAEVLTQQDCIDEAAAEFDRALRVLRRVGDRWTEGILFANLAAFLLERRNDAAEAERHANEALAVLGEVGDHRASILLLLGFAVALVRMARAAEAIAKVDQAREIARKMGDRTRDGEALSVRGWALFEIGRLNEADQDLEAALAILREQGDRIKEATTLRRQAALRQEQGRLVEAEHALSEALDELDERGSRIERAVTRMQLGFLLLEQGQTERALNALDQAVATSSGQVPWLERQVIAMQSIAAARSGDIEGARSLIDELRGQVLDPREADLVGPVSVLIGLCRAAAGDDADQLQIAQSRSRSMIEAPDQGAAERRLALRLLAETLQSD